jgi:hypothetical protein
VLGRKGRAVQLVHEHDLVAKRLREGETPFEALFDVAFDAAVETREEHLDGVVERARFLEEWAEWRAAPFARSDGFKNPRHARRTWLEPCAAVAGALHRHTSSLHRPRANVVERELELVAHASADAQPPAVRIDDGDVEVREEVVEPDGRHVVAQRLEWGAMVARRELELLEGAQAGELGLGGLGHPRDTNP